MQPRQHHTQTRRQVLASGTYGLLGMNQASLLTSQADAHTTTSQPARLGQPPDRPTVLQPGSPTDVGMSTERLQQVSHRLQTETKKRGVLSASILVARYGTVVLHQGFGKLNPHSEAPDTQPDTIYLLASISKPVSICGLMLLVEDGNLVLSDPVQRYLPEFQGDHKKKVTVGHLLCHTSGLPNMLPDNIELRRSHAPLSRFVAEALNTPLLYEPGTQFSYQSMGTLLAGEIVERTEGRRLRDFLARKIFEPLGMRNTVLGLSGLKIEETAIFQENDISDDSRSWGPNSPYWRDMGHPWGGLHGTTGDLGILLQLFLNGGVYGGIRLFSPTTTASMTRDHNFAINAPWGQGWALRDSPVWNYFGDLGSASTFGHVGVTGTVAWADPLRQLICVLLSTRSATHQGGFLLNSISNMVQSAVIKE